MGRGGVTLLERLLPWLERVAPGAFGFLAKFLVEVAGGLVVVVIVGVVVFVVAAKFGGDLLRGFRRHQSFPMAFGVLWVIGSTLVAIPAAGEIGAIAAFFGSVGTAIALHPRLVEIRDNARARELPEKPVTDPSGPA
jgi:hypothetical protein